MIRLDLTTRKLQVVMAGAKTTTEPSCTVSFYEENRDGNRTKGQTQISILNDTSDVDACAAPQQNFVRNIDSVDVYNADTVSQTITVKIDESGTDTILVKAVLAAGATLHHGDSPGWYVTPTGNSAIAGTTTNDSAAAGYIGEFVSSLVAVGSPVSLTNNTTANVASISLTAGDWDVEGNINFSGSTATITGGIGAISTASVTTPSDGSEVYDATATTLLTETSSITMPRKRISIAATTTVYLVARKSFSAGTVVAFGSINARRVR